MPRARRHIAVIEEEIVWLGNSDGTELILGSEP